MRSIHDTIERLSAMRGAALPGGHAAPDRLQDMSPFGSNPGALRARCYVPDHLADNAPLVVVLHGCTQTAAGYDHGSGWSQLADAHGFALLYPEQQRANNANLCFNWFQPGDIRRDAGEALSIRQMVAAMVATHGIDPARIYVTGLSAGGAMTSVMLATYPDVFAGGAVIAGLPYGTAHSVPEAFDRMRAHGGPPAAALGGLVASASPHDGPWPLLSVWHGTADATVHAANATLVVEQWRTLHAVSRDAMQVEQGAGYRRTLWHDGQGRAVIEEYRIDGMGHGTPLATAGAEACGTAGPFMLEAGISSTRRIAAFWGIAETRDRRAGRAVGHAEAKAAPASVARLHRPPVPPKPDADAPTPQVPAANRIRHVIEDALRAAGLMR
jgi:poly(hydroxyalkanoate) depolymerase family esterase